MNKLTTAKRAQVVSALVEGNSIRATVRMTGVAKNTVTSLLVQLGKACAAHHDKAIRNVPCKRIQADEIWSFVYAKNKNVPESKKSDRAGDAWTWVAIDADTKLVVSWCVGDRDYATAVDFMTDVADRLANRVQLTTDGHKAYLTAVEGAFGTDIDFAMLQKLYGPDRSTAARYSPPACIGARRDVVQGSPDPAHVSTSYVERQNLTMRMGMRRFTRLTNGFSKKFGNHVAAIALHFLHYNFCRVHQSLRVTPAMAAGVTDHVWEIEEIVALIG
jgi:IS1 family transposase